MKELDIKNATIITYDEEEIIEIDGARIHALPVWRWLLDDIVCTIQ
jgi:predicted AAA+ superfamily ATPase